MPLGNRIAVDRVNGLAYVSSNEDMLVTVDLQTGERVITAR